MKWIYSKILLENHIIIYWELQWYHAILRHDGNNGNVVVFMETECVQIPLWDNNHMRMGNAKEYNQWKILGI